MAILSSLLNSAIHRLHQTWELLPPITLDLFHNLKDLMDGNAGEGNFADYREALRKTSPPCVPYLGLSLTDLTFLFDGNPYFVLDTKDIINFSKMRKITQIIQQTQIFQQMPYCLEPIIFIQEFMLNREVMSEDQQYKKSIELEEKKPRRARAQSKKDKKKVKPVQVDYPSMNIIVD
eukprot:TRINITY_DN5365_c0_g1_i1.p2 TRINITY_DN5365_c0_g1~~TRINITY_DN5365_c0_g1_i1.p2  ORF type:complete len:177 (+),score=32.21 TRINITY_DN5365_c0_g1_i1:670-1200(+)